MATWLEIRKEILSFLDVDREASTDDDVRLLVDSRMERWRDRLIKLKPPRSLLTESDEVTVTYLTEWIPLGADEATTDVPPVAQPGFDVSDFWKLFSLTINDRDVEYRPWTVYIRDYSMDRGDQRDVRIFTINPSNQFILGWVPSTAGETWTAKLHYYKTAAAVADGTTCEIPDEHLDALILNVVTQFPNMFQGEERQALLGSLKSDARIALQDYLRDKDEMVVKKSLRLRPAARNRSADNFYLLWGDPTSV